MHRFRYLIGTLTLIAAIVGAIWMFQVLRGLDERPGLALLVEFRDARSLRAGADVRYRGVTVGTVRSVTIAADGGKAVAAILLDPQGQAQACVNSLFWIVTPRFGGLVGGASGLDTLVRDAYVAFQTPAERGSPLVGGSLLAGRERPPLGSEVDALEEVEHGDLLMTLLVPENHGLKPGSAVIFRGMTTGDVRAVELAPDGSHVELRLRIARRHRHTVTDRTAFWVARTGVTGALFSGYTVTDPAALLAPYVSYYGDPGSGVLVQDGYRVAAGPQRPAVEIAGVPPTALRPSAPVVAAPTESLVLVRVVYAAVERDTFSADDPIHREGTGLLFLDRAGRAIVVTARSLVDGSYDERDPFDGDPEIADEQTKVMLSSGAVLRAGRVWVHAEQDLAALLLDEVPPDLRHTAAAKFSFEEAPATQGATLHRSGPDGAALPVVPIQDMAEPAAADFLGAAIVRGETVVAIQGGRNGTVQAPTVVPLAILPADLRPQ